MVVVLSFSLFFFLMSHAMFFVVEWCIMTPMQTLSLLYVKPLKTNPIAVRYPCDTHPHD